MGAALEGPFPIQEHGITAGRADTFSPPSICRGPPDAGSPDIDYVFTAPETGTYTVSTEGSALDTIVYLLDGDCFGSEISCNDDVDYGNNLFWSQLRVDLTAGQTVSIVVDSYYDDGAPYRLTIRR